MEMFFSRGCYFFSVEVECSWVFLVWKRSGVERFRDFFIFILRDLEELFGVFFFFLVRIVVVVIS